MCPLSGELRRSGGRVTQRVKHARLHQLMLTNGSPEFLGATPSSLFFRSSSLSQRYLPRRDIACKFFGYRLAARSAYIAGASLRQVCRANLLFLCRLLLSFNNISFAFMQRTVCRMQHYPLIFGRIRSIRPARDWGKWQGGWVLIGVRHQVRIRRGQNPHSRDLACGTLHPAQVGRRCTNRGTLNPGEDALRCIQCPIDGRLVVRG